MKREDLLKHIENDKTMSPEIEAQLDTELDAQSQVSNMVRSLPVEEPSLEWQSRVRQQTQVIVRKARRAALWPLRVAGVSVVGAAACAIFVANMVADRPEKISTEAMLNWHDEAVAASVLPGDSISLAGASTLPSKPAARNDLFDGGSLPSL